MAQGILFFIAGYDTTATSIAFLLYNLALNPDVQEELHDEIVNLAGNEVRHDCERLLFQTGQRIGGREGGGSFPTKLSLEA